MSNTGGKLVHPSPMTSCGKRTRRVARRRSPGSCLSGSWEMRCCFWRPSCSACGARCWRDGVRRQPAVATSSLDRALVSGHGLSPIAVGALELVTTQMRSGGRRHNSTACGSARTTGVVLAPANTVVILLGVDGRARAREVLASRLPEAAEVAHISACAPFGVPRPASSCVLGCDGRRGIRGVFRRRPMCLSCVPVHFDVASARLVQLMRRSVLVARAVREARQ